MGKQSNDFTVEGFAQQVIMLMGMADTPRERQKLLKGYLGRTLEDNDVDYLMQTLDASVPPRATSLQEMVLYADDDLTVLWGQIPPRFQSAIHNHTIFACIAPLIGPEHNILYEEIDGKLQKQSEKTVQPGEVLDLSPDAIHCIENPSNDTAKALHFYGGNFRTISHQRDLWDWDTKKKVEFSFEQLIEQSIKRMVGSKNKDGLLALGNAMPKTKTKCDEALLQLKQDSTNHMFYILAGIAIRLVIHQQLGE